MNNEVIIYALCEPDSGEVRYIGQTVDLNRRFLEHLRNRLYSDGPMAAWLQELWQRNMLPTRKILAIVPKSEADTVERKQIAIHYEQGCRLFNQQHMVAIESESRLASMKAKMEEDFAEIMAMWKKSLDGNQDTEK